MRRTVGLGGIVGIVILSVISAFFIGGIIMGVFASNPGQIDKLYLYFSFFLGQGVIIIPPIYYLKIKKKPIIYKRKISHLTGNNKISERLFECRIQKIDKKELIEIWDSEFLVTKFDELCLNNDLKIKNNYYLDNRNIVRKSLQYHSETVGYIITERIDR